MYGLAGVPALWRSWLGGDFAIFEGAFLEKRANPATSYPCAQECGCEHDLVERADGNYVAVCTCDPWNCDDFVVTRDEAALLELNWPRLGRAICKAFECDFRETDLHLPLTRQIGSKFANAVPVVLTIENDRDEFRQVVAGVVAQLGRPFVLLGPTSRFLDVSSLGLLHGARAEFFDLASHVMLLPGGALQARKSGGELFSRFLPTPEETMGEGEATRVFALMKMLDSGPQKAPLESVFRLLVLEGRSQAYAARACKCSKGLLSLRTTQIEKRMKKSIAELQGLASRLGEISRSPRNLGATGWTLAVQVRLFVQINGVDNQRLTRKTRKNIKMGQ
jgi:hypothetical protein